MAGFVSQLARTERISQRTSINLISAITISYSVMDFDFLGGLSFERFSTSEGREDCGNILR